MNKPALVRLAAGSLLLAERRTAQALRRALNESIDEAVADVAREKRIRDANRAALLLLLLSSGKTMAEKARRALFEGRQHARERAQRRLAIELRAAGVTIDLDGHGLHRRAGEDHGAGGIAAESLAARWRGQASAAVLRADRQGKDAAAAVDDTRAAMNAGVYRTAATETASAYNDEHRAALNDAYDVDSSAFGSVELVRVWDAILDTRTCAECRQRDGMVTGVGRSFSEGEEPPLHPLCRCIVVVMSAAQAAKMAA